MNSRDSSRSDLIVYESWVKEPLEAMTVEQLALLVLDGSGSMADVGLTGASKAEEVAQGVAGFLGRLNRSSKRHAFHACVICFDANDIEVRAYPFPVSDDAQALRDPATLNPLLGHGDSTPIGTALERAWQVAQDFLAAFGEMPREVLLFLLSDGQHNHGPAPEPIADRIKACEQVKLITVAYGGDADEARLERLTSGPRFFLQTSDPEEWRNFLLESSGIAVG